MLLDLPGKPQDHRIVVAMSGGVDSSVAAALMVEAGYDVIGITLQLYDQGAMVAKKGACCAGQDIYDARQVCDKLGIPHYILDYESRFHESVMNDFADSYLRGETPIPCVRCNQNVKFKDLLSTARDLGAEALVTGHYVQRFQKGEKSELHRAVDPIRDQSYFLFATTQNQLDFLRFPLGSLNAKTETRKHAKRFGLEIAEKPDSQDICFVPNGSYVSVVEKLRPGSLEEGEILHLDGRVLGTHTGIIGYTVGQRKGLGIGGGEPLYVVGLDPKTHRVYVGPKEALAKSEVYIQELNWLGEQTKETFNALVKIRSAHKPVPAKITLLENGKARVQFDSPEYGVSAGQACVVYDGNRVLGGGWIERDALF
ncbi:tRNA 2-thiouridine(34) synthase MnmA [Candidatus Bealeia paramacronuclearis]|uniref:tRNA-specific 2-thiouridylase MnmA n=1 Tax=Candidatus Bealeia paramacronuclearis TaxID=1921001 RepID=A0ABZ2C7H5_9PROT|nr:tRNA 2-thiouridine(34) synthase MnmA [Candidatus Bealeia paramacronuclearis]